MRKLLALCFLLLASPVLAQSIGPQNVQVRPAGSGGPSIDDIANYTLTQIPYSTGITRQNTATFRAAYNSHSRNAIVATFGDSTMMGVNETAIPYNSQYPNGAPRQLATYLTSIGIPASSQNFYGIGGATLADYLLRNGWTTTSGAASIGTTAVQGGIGWNLTATGGTVLFSPPGVIDTCQFYYSDGNNTRSIDYSIDGAAAVNVPFSATSRIARTTPLAMGTAGTHTLSMAFGTGSSGGVTVYGADCWNSASVGIDIWQYAASGFQSANLINNSGAPSAGRLQQLTNFPPDLAIVEMGTNDWRNSVPVATFKSNMTTFVQFLKGLGTSVILFMPLPDNSVMPAGINQDDYVQAVNQISTEQGVGLINIRNKWINYATAVNAGFQYNPGFTAAVTVTGATYSAQTGLATYTVGSTSTLTTGAITAVTSIVSSGGSVNGYNAVGPITVVNSTTFTMAVGVNPGTYTSGGTAVGVDSTHPMFSGNTDISQVLGQAINKIIRNNF